MINTPLSKLIKERRSKLIKSEIKRGYVQCTYKAHTYKVPNIHAKYNECNIQSTKMYFEIQYNEIQKIVRECFENTTLGHLK